ncbi:MAG: type 4b pilus protein PilO2 [Phreatobacter sp.]|nr:type 4b pilus protein PilO2 [Phreatobacter sp.]
MDKGPVQTRKTLVIAGKEHAVGLRWRILNDPGNARAEAAEAAMDGENLFVSTSAGTPAIGLGNTASGHAAGMPSLAGRLAAAVNGNWSGLFSLDGAYYVVAVRGGIVDDRSDVVFIDKADALKAFVDVASGGAGRILVTADLVGDLTTFPSVEAFEPLTFLTGALKPALEEIEQRFTLPVRQIAIGAVAAGLAAIFLFNPAGLYDRVKTAVGLGPKVEKQVIVIPPAPWAGQPKAPAMIRACTAGFALVPSWIRAWKVDRVECDGRTLTIAVSRAGTLDASAPPVTWLDDWVRNSGTLASDLIKLDRPTLNRSQQGNITIVWRLPAYRPQDRWREADSPEPMAEEQRRLWLEMERRYVPVNIAAGQATQYFGSTQINVVFDIFQTERVVAAMDRRVQVASRLTFDVASRRVTAGTRIFARLQPFPSGDNVEVLRQPSLAQVEGPNLPAPPP